MIVYESWFPSSLGSQRLVRNDLQQFLQFHCSGERLIRRHGWDTPCSLARAVMEVFVSSLGSLGDDIGIRYQIDVGLLLGTNESSCCSCAYERGSMQKKYPIQRKSKNSAQKVKGFDGPIEALQEVRYPACG